MAPAHGPSDATSRICVKNIPRYLSEDRFREHFATKGTVTDVKIIKTSDGRSRQFGFIGYRTEEEAVEAAKYFHRSFIDTCRISCEIARQVGDASLPRPWSRHSHGSSAFENAYVKSIESGKRAEDEGKGGGKEKGSKVQHRQETVESDPKFREFMEVMKPRRAMKLWANDTVGDGEEITPSKGKEGGVGGGGGNNKQKQRVVGADGRQEGGAAAVAAAEGLKGKLRVKEVEGFQRRVPIGKGRSGVKLRQMHVRFDAEEDEESDGESGREGGAGGAGGAEGNEHADSSDDDSELYEDVPMVEEKSSEAQSRRRRPRAKHGREHRDDAAAAAAASDDDDDEEEEEEEGEEEEHDDGVVQNHDVSDMDYLKSRVKADWSDDDGEAGEVQIEDDERADPVKGGGGTRIAGGAVVVDVKDGVKLAHKEDEGTSIGNEGGRSSDDDERSGAKEHLADDASTSTDGKNSDDDDDDDDDDGDDRDYEDRRKERKRGQSAAAADRGREEVKGGRSGIQKGEGDEVGTEEMQDEVMDDKQQEEEVVRAKGRHRPAEVDAEEEEGIAESGRLFVRNLPYGASEEDLLELFSGFGEISHVHLVMDKREKRNKGFAYVLFMLPENAVAAKQQLDGSIFQGRLLHILPAKRAPESQEKDEQGGGGGAGGGRERRGPGSALKQEREAARKAAEAKGRIQSWNSLFMRSDTVAENIVQKYGITKGELLDASADDLAVRMALGETQIIAVTKKALQAEGVDVCALEQLSRSGDKKKPTTDPAAAVKRSKSVILVKNLPFSATHAEITHMFSRHGELGRVVLPPTRTLALVEFSVAADAQNAFKALAYKRFKHVPLYLEWAPEGVLRKDAATPPAPAAGKMISKGMMDAKHLHAEELAGVDADEDAAGDGAKGCSLFVKNLNFSTTESVLRQFFLDRTTPKSKLRRVTIKTKKAKNGAQLSMGFGFVEFDSVESAQAAVKQLQGSMLDGHALMLQLSQDTRKGGAQGREEQRKGGGGGGGGAELKKEKSDSTLSSTKVIVRNVAFEATSKDLRQLFAPFGQVKSLRLPKKFDGSHRGFAFVEFTTKQEAQNAYEALRHSHLYGRHLVLERAKEGEGLEELRARTAAQFIGESGIAPGSHLRKRAKLSHHVFDDAEMPFAKLAAE